MILGSPATISEIVRTFSPPVFIKSVSKLTEIQIIIITKINIFFCRDNFYLSQIFFTFFIVCVKLISWRGRDLKEMR